MYAHKISIFVLLNLIFRQFQMDPVGTPRPVGRGRHTKPPPRIQEQHIAAKGKRAPLLPPRVGIALFLNWGTDEKSVSKRPEYHDLVMPGMEVGAVRAMVNNIIFCLELLTRTMININMDNYEVQDKKYTVGW